ncbi:hypothetical protein HGRIS_006402 [Hohenbuehelia grisea]|uniref:Uncharacterized protein n=1 Tax=Hohenbuehelia grisea TaxID=104357 RepID=A0ABR3K2N2_9AGAR
MSFRRPQAHLLQSKERPSSAIYIGSAELYTSPPNLPDLPEPPSPVASVGSHGSGLPSPPATNSTGSGSARGDIDNSSPTGGILSRRQRPAYANMLSDENVKTLNASLASSSSVSPNASSEVAKGKARSPEDSDSLFNESLGPEQDDDDFSDDGRLDGENEDNTARLDRRPSTKSTSDAAPNLNRVLSLTHRNRMVLDKISRTSSPSQSPSPGPSRFRSPPPAAPSSSSSSSNTASSRLSVANSRLSNSHSPRPRHSDTTPLRNDSVYAYDRDVLADHLSGSETERESTRHSNTYHAPSIALSNSYSSSSSGQYTSPDSFQGSGSNSLSNSVISASSQPPTQFSTSSTSQAGASLRPRTPPSQRLRRTSAPASPAKALALASSSRNSSRTRTPRKRASMAMSAYDYVNEDGDEAEDNPEYHDGFGRSSVMGERFGSRTNSRMGFLAERESNISRASQRAEDVTRAALAAVAQSRRSPVAGRHSPGTGTTGTSKGPSGITRKPLPREFRDPATGTPDIGRRGSFDAERAPSRASGRQSMEPQTPDGFSPRLPYVNGSGPRTSPRRATNRASTVREITRRHQTRFLSEDMSSVYSRDEEDNRQGNGVIPGAPGAPESRLGAGVLGRRPSLRGGSAESALAATGRLAGEGLRAAGLAKRDGGTLPRRDVFASGGERRSTITARDMAYDTPEPDRQADVERRSQSRLSGRYSEDAPSARTRSSGVVAPMAELRTPNPPIRRDSDFQTARRVDPAPRAATSMAQYQSLVTPDPARFSRTTRLNGVENGFDDSSGRGVEEEDPPMTAPPALRTYRSSLGLETRAGSSQAQPARYSSPIGSTRRSTVTAATPRTVGAASREQQAEHTRLMRESLSMFASNVDRLKGDLQLWDLVRGAESVVGTTERLNDIMRTAANDAMQHQIDADVNSDEAAGNVWRTVGADWRDTLRSSDELVRGLTGFLLSVGKAVRDLGASVDGRAGGRDEDLGQSRPVSLDEEGLRRVSISPEVMSNGGSDRRSVGSRRSWEPSTQRERDREEALQKLSSGAGVTAARNGTYMAAPPTETRPRRGSPLPQRASTSALNGHGVVSSSSMRRISNVEDQTMELEYPLVPSSSKESGIGYEPSPTPASRIQNPQPLTNHLVSNHRLLDREHTRSVPPLAVPPPLPTLPSESLLQRNHTVNTSRPSVRERRQRPSIASVSTIRPAAFPTITTGNPTTAVTAHTVTMSPEERHQAFSFPVTRTDSEQTATSGHPHNPPVRSNTVTFSRATDVSVSSTLTGLRDRDVVRQRTISATSSVLDEPSTSAPRVRAFEAVKAAQSGSETERDTRRRTVGTRAGADGAARGSRVGGAARGSPTLPASTGKRERRPTISEIFPKS